MHGMLFEKLKKCIVFYYCFAGVPFPDTIPVKYCGESYLLAVLDVYNEVIEYNEDNNVA